MWLIIAGFFAIFNYKQIVIVKPFRKQINSIFKMVLPS